MAVGDYLQELTYDYFLNLSLSMIPDKYDKRQGSIPFYALAPPSYVAGILTNIIYYGYRDMYVLTATGEALDNLVAFQGLTRYQATYAIRKGEFFDQEGSPMEIPIGNRFRALTSANVDRQTFVVIGPYLDSNNVAVPGQYRLQCEQPGTFGNTFPGTIQEDNRGNILALDTVNGLATALITDLLVPARDVESDDDLRDRFMEQSQARAFGGNVAQYLELLHSIDGVGAVQVYPIWNGGGTVAVSILDASGNIASADFIADVQNQLDPENADGQQGTGIGLVPIGHWVTVKTPTEVPINITATVELADGYSLSATQIRINTALQNYINQQRSQWANYDSYYNYALTVYYAQILSTIVNVEGVQDLISLTVNGGTSNIEMTETGTLQQIPSLGTVTISEA